ncbi:MAG: AraC family transcriptional regulator [Taibaiella sp.]|jgi:transcriptional regulator GlxA family with amidase domain
MISQSIASNTLFCNHLLKAPATIFGITEEIHMKYIAEAVDYMNKNYNKDISLNEITKQAYLSKFHFSRIFKRHTSYSPYQYLITVRLNHSRQLLSGSNYSVKEVADLCGFKRLDYFSAMFKKKFKYSPSMYRENYSAAV